MKYEDEMKAKYHHRGDFPRFMEDACREVDQLRDGLAWLAKNAFYVSDDSTSAAPSFRVRTPAGEPVGAYAATPIAAIEAARANPLAPR